MLEFPGLQLSLAYWIEDEYVKPTSDYRTGTCTIYSSPKRPKNSPPVYGYKFVQTDKPKKKKAILYFTYQAKRSRILLCHVPPRSPRMGPQQAPCGSGGPRRGKHVVKEASNCCKQFGASLFVGPPNRGRSPAHSRRPRVEPNGTPASVAGENPEAAPNEGTMDEEEEIFEAIREHTEDLAEELKPIPTPLLDLILKIHLPIAR